MNDIRCDRDGSAGNFCDQNRRDPFDGSRCMNRPKQALADDQYYAMRGEARRALIPSTAVPGADVRAATASK